MKKGTGTYNLIAIGAGTTGFVTEVWISRVTLEKITITIF